MRHWSTPMLSLSPERLLPKRLTARGSGRASRLPAPTLSLLSLRSASLPLRPPHRPALHARLFAIMSMSYEAELHSQAGWLDDLEAFLNVAQHQLSPGCGGARGH